MWCLQPLKGGQRKWCSEECVSYALAWARPQTGHGLAVLLERQGYACAECQLDYKPYWDQALAKQNRWPGRDLPTQIDRHMRWLKRLVPDAQKPEVDHIVGVAIGGQTLGFDNTQVLCRPCHKAKTKLDCKVRHEKLGNKLKGKLKSESHKQAMSKSRKGFDSEARKAHREKIYGNLRTPILAINVNTKEERQFSSLQEAANALGLQVSNISRVLRKAQNRTQHKGWTFHLKN